MSLLDRLRNTFRRDVLDRETDEEMRFHLEMRERELRAEGLSEAEARRATRQRFGNVTLAQEQSRDRDLLPWLEFLGRDVRHALRTLRQSPGFTTAAVLSLALGIGANTAIFSLTNAVLLRALPVPQPEQLHQLVLGDGAGSSFTNPLWEEFRRRQDVFSGTFAYGARGFDLSDQGEQQPVAGAYVSGNFFEVLGVPAILGRTLTPTDDQRGGGQGGPVVVVSHSFWQSHYGGDPAVLGRTLRLFGKPFQVIGVAAPGFSGVHVGRDAALFVPLSAEDYLAGLDSMLDNRSAWWLRVLGRLPDHVTETQANERFRALAPGLLTATLPSFDKPAQRQEYLEQRLRAVPAPKGLSAMEERVNTALVALSAAVALVLLIACVNLANLLLARNSARQGEWAVRRSLGATTGRILRQQVIEGLLLSVSGALAGSLLAVWAVPLLVRAFSTIEDPIFLQLTPDVQVLAFTAGLTLGSALLVTLVPALWAARVPPQATLAGASRTLTGRHRQWIGPTLVATQVALCLVLLVGAGLFARTLQRLTSLDSGFQINNVLLVDASLEDREPNLERRALLYHAVLDRLRRIPGTVAATRLTMLPFGGGAWTMDVTIRGHQGERSLKTHLNTVSPGYFATFSTPIVAGRNLTEQDDKSRPAVALVNETWARQAFGTQTAIGRQFHLPIHEPVARMDVPGGSNVQRVLSVEIVGIVKDAKYRSLREPPPPTAYMAALQEDGSPAFTAFALRHTPGAAIVPALRKALAEVAPQLSFRLTPFATLVEDSIATERTIAGLCSALSLLALVLVVVGLYGVVSYSVARRRGEIGIRMALGADRGRVLALVLRQAAWLLVVGMALGLVLALAVTRLAESLLYGVKPHDPLTLALACAVLLAAALGAAFLPARRAARTDPMVALRAE